MKGKIFSILLTVMLVVGFSLISAMPAMAILPDGTTVTLTVPDNVYRPEEFVVSSTTTNSGTAYTNVRFNIIVDGPVDFTGDQADTFTITKVNGSSETQGINDTFMLVGGDWVGYWGPADGFLLSDPYGVSSTFTTQMDDMATAPLGNYEVTVELVDLTPDPDVILATATDSFSLSDDTLYVGTTEYQYQFTTIQSAVDAANAGDTINVAAGEYNENITVNKLLTLLGPNTDVNPVTAGRGTEAIINGGETGDAVTISSDDVTIKGFEITSGTSGIVAGARSGLEISNNIIHHNINPVDQQGCGITIWAAAGPCNNNLIENNVVYSNERQGIFIGTNEAESNSTGNTVRGNKVYDNGTDGYDSFGIQLNYASGNTIENNEVYGHTYTSVSWLASGIYLYNANDNNIVGNSIHDNNDGICQWIPDGTVQALEDNEAHFNNIVDNTGSGIGNFTTEAPINATNNWWGSANGPEHAGNTFNVGAQGDAVSDNVDYVPWLNAAYPTGTSFAPVTTDEDPVGEYSSIQAAIDGVTGTTISCAAGTYTEAIVIDKPLTLRGATYDVNKNGYTVPAGYAWDSDVESIINNPSSSSYTVVDIDSVNDVTFEGFVVQALSIPESGNVQNLLRVSADAPGTCDNIIVRNNIIGPNTDVDGQDGTRGRMGLYLATPTYPTTDGEGITNSTFSGNKIFDCLGNGNNVFVWGAAESYGSIANADYTGTVIEDNEICNSHLSGIEIAGGVSNLVIRNNNIYGNTGLPSDDSTKLKYGTGIVIIRMGSDKTSSTACGSSNIQITGNNICDNEKNGIYLGPINANHTITGNTFSGNGWDAIRVDLNEEYHGGTSPVTNAVANIATNLNNISSNTGYGVQVIGTPTNGFVLDATENWWGDISGPEQATTNPGGLGNDVSDNVDYAPWLTREFQTALDDNIAYYGFPMVDMNTGWNIFSTPVALDPACDTWDEYVALGDGLAIDPAATTYYFDSGNQVYGQVLGNYQLKSCDAIYVKMAEPDISAILYSPNVSVPSKNVYSGWNLIGLANLDEMSVENALISIEIVPGDFLSVGYSMVVSPPVNQDAWTCPPSGWETSMMQPTKGYWVFMINDGTLAGFTFTPMSLD